MGDAAEVQTDDVFEVGVRVVMHSLASRADLNGLQGLVCGTLTEAGRLPIKVGRDTLALKPSCIRKAAYPEEPVLNAHAEATMALLTEVSRKHLARLQKSTMCLFEGKDRNRKLSDQAFQRSISIVNAELAYRNPGAPSIVDEGTFVQQFSAFTSGLFDDWELELWTNVLVAGGAVLACLQPPPRNYERMKPVGGSWIEYDLYGQRRRLCGGMPARFQ